MLRAVSESKGRTALALALGLGIGYVGKKFYGRMYSQSGYTIEAIEEIKNKGSQYFKDGKFDLALKEFDEALERILSLNSTDVDASERSKLVAIIYKNRATTKEKLNYKKADIVDDYKQALRYNKLYKLAYTQLARLYWREQDGHQALKYLLCANFCKEGPQFRPSDGAIMEYAQKASKIVTPPMFAVDAALPLNYGTWRDVWQGEDIFKVYSDLTEKASLKRFQKNYHIALTFPTKSSRELSADAQEFVEKLLDAKLWLYTPFFKKGAQYKNALEEGFQLLSEEDEDYDKIVIAYYIYQLELCKSYSEISNVLKDVIGKNFKDHVLAEITAFGYNAMYIQNFNECIDIPDKYSKLQAVFELNAKYGKPSTNMKLEREFFKLMMHLSRGEIGNVIPIVQEIDNIAETGELNAFSHTLVAMAMHVGSTKEIMMKHLEKAKSMPHHLHLEAILTHERLLESQDQAQDGFTDDIAQRLLDFDPYNTAANIGLVRSEMEKVHSRPLPRDVFDKMMVLHKKAAVFADGDMRDINETSHYFNCTTWEATRVYEEGL